MKSENNPVASQQEKYFLNTFPLIQHLTWKKLGRFYLEAVEDIVQTVILKLWRWKQNRPEEKELTKEEWLKLANTATQNEIRTFFSTQLKQGTALVQLPVLALEEDIFARNSAEAAPSGNTPAELRSLLLVVWEAINLLTLREKYALLLRRRYLINELTSHRCCRTKEIADALDLPLADFPAIYAAMPLKAHEIAALLEKRVATRVTAKQILEARHRARTKIKASLSSIDRNERTPVEGKNKDVFSRSA